MEGAFQDFINFVYFLIDLIRDLVISVSGKADKPRTEEPSETAEA